MLKKNYTDLELDERLNLFWLELNKQATELNSNEFEFYWEIWGVMWMPWFIEINGMSLHFTANDISNEDLELLIKMDFIEVIKVYESSELKDEFDRKKYRLLKNE
ncbi:hypothetical protein GKZ90_0021980 [Flavobacterium sp. MC2016-06]|jgi:hypothetical protein|uniref:hypothetical protein n=1 Tax=Flavobacterium sp. MC2016-06 TaxID=2676308 RepID=UPI0012BAE40D|nr:hypothetical protein [Flavobacterium sp. MC2016-06]MBU3861124.1 hypothetical protein [Flavobacterium sp. MC2016-06]